MSKTPPDKYESVPGSPVKSFFVSMLTRDITLKDAILDLLDNCVDGIQRAQKGKRKKAKPYEGYHAYISYSKNEFQITDNCGGIPWSLKDYAFRMGRSGKRDDDNIPTVGVYGIGMKRAIFKIGQHCILQTKHKKDCYEVEITPKWLLNEDEWDIPVKESTHKTDEDGTTIVITKLSEAAKGQFGTDFELFDKEFRRQIATHYAFIINKGFEVFVNGEKIEARPTALHFDTSKKKSAIRPFIFQAKVENVEVFLAVGFTQAIPSEEEVRDDQEEQQFSSMDAGWTVVCNDRAVLYCDRTELTGWGEAGVPKYHTQFTAIAGVVEFRSNNAGLLPTTTTKRGIDASSRLYLQVKNKMREGMKMFTDFTNKWKGQELAQDAKRKIQSVEALAVQDIRAKVGSRSGPTMKKTRQGGSQYKPILPMPPQSRSGTKRISYARDVSDIRELGEALLSDPDATPSEVGAECFDQKLGEVRK